MFVGYGSGGPLLGTRKESFVASGRFRPNGTGAVTVTGGDLEAMFTVAYSATGIYTVTMAKGINYSRPPVILLGKICADLTNTNRFLVNQIGDWNKATRSFAIQCSQEATPSTGFPVPSDPNNWITFTLTGSTSNAKRT